MSSPVALHLSRKRPLTPEQDSPSHILDKDAKKIRISPAAPSASRPDKKRRRKKKRTTSVVEGRSSRGNSSLDRRASNSSILTGAKPVSPLAEDHHNGDTNEAEEPIASSSYPAGEEPPTSAPSPRRLSSSMKVDDLLSPIASSLKRKERTTTPRPPSPLTLPKTQDQTLNMHAQITDLKNQLALHKEKLDNQSNLLSTFQQSLMCQICVDLMYKPYALSPCGHLVCYDCLVRWFKTPPTSAPLLGNYNPVHKRKTCPHCRTVVRERPIEVYSVKEMVGALNKSGFVTGLPPHEFEPATAPVGRAIGDPWQGIFLKHSARHNHIHPLPLFIDDELPPDFGPLHPDLDSEDGPEDEEGGFMGLYDEEDAVYRCEECMHEIWNGVCTECGRIYAGFQEPVDLADIDDEDEDLGQPGFHFHIGGPALMNQAMHLGMMFQPSPLGLLGNFADEENTEEGSDGHPMIVEDGQDEDEDGYESSFIDDEGPEVIDLAGSANEPIVISSPFPRPARRAEGTRNTRRSIVVISSDEEDSDVGSTSRPARRANHRASTCSSSAARPPLMPSGMTRRRRLSPDDEGTTRNSDQICWDSDEGSHSTNRFASPVSDGGGEEDDGSISRPPINLAHLLQGGNFSDDDGEDREGSEQKKVDDEPSSDESDGYQA